MKKPIIPITRASEVLIDELIKAGILEVTEDGVKVKEKQTHIAWRQGVYLKQQSMLFLCLIMTQRKGKVK